MPNKRAEDRGMRNFLNQAAQRDRVPASWPTASKIWWRWTVVRQLRDEAEQASPARRSWLPPLLLAAVGSCLLTAVNLVVWSGFERLLSSGEASASWTLLGPSFAVAGLLLLPFLLLFAVIPFLDSPTNTRR